LKRADDISVNRVDWLTIAIYIVIVSLGWLNIYAAVYDEAVPMSILDMTQNSGRQFLFIMASFILIGAVMLVDMRFYETFAYLIYAVIILLLIFVLVTGTVVAGSKSWFSLGAFRFQPSEFAKFATALACAKFISTIGFRFDTIKNQLGIAAIVGLPVLLIMLQGDTGTALVFTAFVLVFYREGLTPMILILGVAAAIIFILTLLVENQIYLHLGILATLVLLILTGKKTFKRIAWLSVGAILIAGVIESVDYVITDVLKPHQQNRIKALINPDADPLGYGWNVTQSKIAIGSGGMWGKGFLKGTQTKFDFVPEQSTDFIFCTIGEEHGWFGSLIVVSLFVALLLRLIFLAERQKSRFSRVFGYSVASIIFFHFAVNIGMTIGLFPVIGIPLPFFSYGGSSLWAFTILLFIFLKLDAHRMQMLTRF
jgi:rod shape determining protein RodA